MEYTVPLSATPNQQLITNLSNQRCLITVRTMGDDMFFTLELPEGVVCENVLCVDRSQLVRAEYTGFIGDLAFIDIDGNDSPKYEGLGTRWFLVYDTEGFK